MTSKDPIALRTHNLTMRFGGLTAVNELSIEVAAESIFGMIGPNGAGKTTVFNMLTGVYRPTCGSIEAFGQNLVGLHANQIVAYGISRTFQNIRLFKNLSVIENLIIALDNNCAFGRSSVSATILRSSSFTKLELAKYSTALELLELLGLAGRANDLARNLPYGPQRRLEIARALATGARIILLDEPAAGMSGRETEDLMQIVTLIRTQRHLTIVLIEHDMEFVMGICERIAVLDYGKKIAEGAPAEIQKDARVIKAYLGTTKDSP